jgi:putative phage-type endonuclease
MGREKYEIINCSSHENWLRVRSNGIGGSDASAIVGLNPYKNNLQLYDEKCGITTSPDISDKPYVIYGTKAEEYIRELFKLDYPRYQVKHSENTVLRSKQYPFMQASLDGELTDLAGRKGILEIKTSNIMHGGQWEKWNNKIPDNYYIQVLHYLIVTGHQFIVLRAHLNSVRDTKKETLVKHYFIEREEILEDLKFLLKEEIKFWNCVKKRRKPNLVLPPI